RDLHEPAAAAREPAALPDGAAARPGDAGRSPRARGRPPPDALRRQPRPPDTARGARLLGDRAAGPRAARGAGAARLRGGVAAGRAGRVCLRALRDEPAVRDHRRRAGPRRAARRGRAARRQRGRPALALLRERRARSGARAAPPRGRERRGGGRGDRADLRGAEGMADQMGTETGETPRNFELLLDIPLEVTVEIGRTRLPLRTLLQLGAGSVIELAKLAGEPLDVLVNGKPIARG